MLVSFKVYSATCLVLFSWLTIMSNYFKEFDLSKKACCENLAMIYYGKIVNCKLHMPISNQLTAGHLNQSNRCEETETERSTVCTCCCGGCSPA